MRKYAVSLTKEELINDYHVTNIDPKSGNVYVKDFPGFLPQLLTNSGNKGRQYYTINMYNFTKHVSKAIGVHRLNYCWNRGDIPEGIVVDHINNDPLDNDINNLQLLTPGDNIRKDRPHREELKVKVIPGVNTLNFIQDKLDFYEKMAEEYKDDPKKVHICRTTRGLWKSKMRYYEEHKDEIIKLEELYRKRLDVLYGLEIAKKNLKDSSKMWHAMVKEKAEIDSKIKNFRKKLK